MLLQLKLSGGIRLLLLVGVVLGLERQGATNEGARGARRGAATRGRAAEWLPVRLAGACPRFLVVVLIRMVQLLVTSVLVVLLVVTGHLVAR